MTTYPARVRECVRTLRTILMQSYAPYKVLLVLSREQFSGVVPVEFKEFHESQVEIIFDEGDIRSYKKLLPALERYPECIIVTADDDVLYPRWWLPELVAEHMSAPTTILGHRGARITVDEGRIARYVDWPRATRNTPSTVTFLTGMGGILYPPNSLDDHVLDRKLAASLCPDADDIWFKVCALLAGTDVRKVSDGAGEFHVQGKAQLTALHRNNVGRHENDRHLKKVFEHFKLIDGILADSPSDRVR
ncbi:hypothetical protein [Gordonia sp. YY1]|uniref:hypothetical protein n=1 Tax=Gordonia sp. YY1 TaxID=396712 RepID=UPI0013314AA3|nr:hypothetical protein [Gordonia sp. YY1]